jgi:hypothetical protein
VTCLGLCVRCVLCVVCCVHCVLAGYGLAQLLQGTLRTPALDLQCTLQTRLALFPFNRWWCAGLRYSCSWLMHVFDLIDLVLVAGGYQDLERTFTTLASSFALRVEGLNTNPDLSFDIQVPVSDGFTVRGCHATSPAAPAVVVWTLLLELVAGACGHRCHRRFVYCYC